MPATLLHATPAAAERPALARWSTDGVPPEQQLDFWTGAVCEAYLRVECNSTERGEFQGVIEAVAASGLVFSRMQAPRQAMRVSSSGEGGCKDAFFLTTDRQAPWTLKQHGQVRQLRAGDVALIDARTPYEVVFQQATNVTNVEVPTAWVATHLRAVDADGPRVIARDAGWGRVLSSLCLELGNDLGLVAQMPPGMLADQIGALLSAALEPADRIRPDRRGPALLARAEQVLAQRLGEPGLSVEAIARALGISVRSLHRAFAASGATVASRLREARLAQAMRMLARPNLAGLSIAEIGLRCGFQDPSHFSREFHRHCGMPPGKWRQQPPAPGLDMGPDPGPLP